MPDASTLALYRTNAVPDDIGSSVDDYAAASSVDEYTAGSATGDNSSSARDSSHAARLTANLCACFGTAVLPAHSLVHSSNVLQLVVETSSDSFDRDVLPIS